MKSYRKENGLEVETVLINFLIYGMEKAMEKKFSGHVLSGLEMMQMECLL